MTEKKTAYQFVWKSRSTLHTYASNKLSNQF